jgi:hypothetical protein
MPDKPHDERREFRRLPLVRPARLITPESSPLEGETLDVSFSGLFLRCPPRLTAGSACAISLSTGASGDGPSVRMGGIVRRVTAGGLGVSLSPLSIDALTRLQTLVASKYEDRATLFEEVRRYQARLRTLQAGPSASGRQPERGERRSRHPGRVESVVYGVFACTAGRDKGKLFELKDDEIWVLGRSTSCDLVLDDPNASRAHCRIERHGNDLFVRDLASANGTLVNNRPVLRQPLSSGDCLQIGKTSLVLQLPARQLRAPAETAVEDRSTEIHWIS